MKADIHPNYEPIKVICSCGNEFETRSTLGEELHIEVCSSCHPFYTGQIPSQVRNELISGPHRASAR
jgi:large subunit ribosomal protein L31